VLLDHASLARRDRVALGLLNDSKQMSPEEREELYPVVLRAARRVAVQSYCVSAIDSRGLHVSNLAALGVCLERVAVDGAACLVDGFRLPGCRVDHQAVVDGDARSAAIAAASVVAKVTRDRYMRRADGVHPGWDFAGNVGYSTPEHRAAIREIGISGLHRRSFNSIAYSQLELAGDDAAELIEAGELEDSREAAGLEGVPDVVVAEDPPAAVEQHPDHVEAERADAA
jgi:ribonuclease HII